MTSNFQFHPLSIGLSLNGGWHPGIVRVLRGAEMINLETAAADCVYLVDWADLGRSLGRGSTSSKEVEQKCLQWLLAKFALQTPCNTL